MFVLVAHFVSLWIVLSRSRSRACVCGVRCVHASAAHASVPPSVVVRVENGGAMSADGNRRRAGERSFRHACRWQRTRRMCCHCMQQSLNPETYNISHDVNVVFTTKHNPHHRKQRARRRSAREGVAQRNERSPARRRLPPADIAPRFPRAQPH